LNRAGALFGPAQVDRIVVLHIAVHRTADRIFDLLVDYFRAPALHEPWTAGITNRLTDPLSAVDADRLLLLFLHRFANLAGGRSLLLVRNHDRIGLFDVVGHRVIHAARGFAVFLVGHHHRVRLFDILGHVVVHAAGGLAVLLVRHHHRVRLFDV